MLASNKLKSFVYGANKCHYVDLVGVSNRSFVRL